MVTGLASFKKQFEGMENQYIIIGGTACDLQMSEIGEELSSLSAILLDENYYISLSVFFRPEFAMPAFRKGIALAGS